MANPAPGTSFYCLAPGRDTVSEPPSGAAFSGLKRTGRKTAGVVWGGPR